MELKQIVQILKKAYEEELGLEVVYRNSFGVTNEYSIWDIEPDTEYGDGKINRNGYIKAYCGYKDDEEYDNFYIFKISRFEDIYGYDDDFDYEDEFYEDDEDGDNEYGMILTMKGIGKSTPMIKASPSLAVSIILCKWKQASAIISLILGFCFQK